MISLDLHMHSSHSADGEIPPAQLVSMANHAGVDYMAIADHNRATAVTEAVAEGKKHGISVIPAIEIDCLFAGVEIHLLGYFIDYQDKRYRDLWENMAAQERVAAAKRIELVQELGIHLDNHAVMAMAKDGIVTYELLAEIALADPKNMDNPLLLPYRPGGARDNNPYVNFYWDHGSQGKPAFVEIAIMPLRQAVELVKDTGGIPIIAHPGQSLAQHKDKLPDILAEGAMGLEAYSSYHSPEESVYWREQAEKAGVLFTCGSDFHGKTKPAIKIGSHGGDEWSDSILASLMNLRQL